MRLRTSVVGHLVIFPPALPAKSNRLLRAIGNNKSSHNARTISQRLLPTSNCSSTIMFAAPESPLYQPWSLHIHGLPCSPQTHLIPVTGLTASNPINANPPPPPKIPRRHRPQNSIHPRPPPRIHQPTHQRLSPSSRPPRPAGAPRRHQDHTPAT